MRRCTYVFEHGDGVVILQEVLELEHVGLPLVVDGVPVFRRRVVGEDPAMRLGPLAFFQELEHDLE